MSTFLETRIFPKRERATQGSFQTLSISAIVLPPLHALVAYDKEICEAGCQLDQCMKAPWPAALTSPKRALATYAISVSHSFMLVP